MSAWHVAADVALAIGIAIEIVSCAGLVTMRGVYDRLHYVAPSALGAVLVTAAIWLRQGPSTISLEATLLAAFLLVATPALAHGTARAARISEHGQWEAGSREGIEVEDG